MVAIAKAGLLSRSLRKSASGSKNGIRKIDLTAGIESIKDKKGGIIASIFQAGKRLLGFISKGLKFITWSASAIFEWGVERYYELVNFDWNESDAELRSRQNEYTISLAKVWGGMIGGGLGRIAVIGLGFGITYSLPMIGGAQLAKAVLSGQAADVASELLFSIQFAAKQTVGTVARVASISGYIRLRRLLKRLNPSWEKWGAADGPRWTIADAIDEKVENIKNPIVKGFVEGALDGFEDGFIEQGFAVAQAVDEQIALQNTLQNGMLGRESGVTVWPDRDSDETFYIEGPSRLVRQEIQSQLISHQRIDNRDFGQILTAGLEAPTPLIPQLRKLKIQFFDQTAPPWQRNKIKPIEATVSIPDCRPGLTWQKIREVVPKSFTRGPIYVQVKLSSKRKMATFAASEQEGAKLLRSLAKLSIHALDEQSWQVDTFPGRRPDDLPKRELVHRAFASLIYPKRRKGVNSGPLGKNLRMSIWGTAPKDLELFTE